MNFQNGWNTCVLASIERVANQPAGSRHIRRLAHSTTCSTRLVRVNCDADAFYVYALIRVHVRVHLRTFVRDYRLGYNSSPANSLLQDHYLDREGKLDRLRDG